METIHGFTRKELLEVAWEKPVMAQIAVTKNCNQRCLFCFRSCGPEELYPELFLAEWKTIIEKCRRLGVRKLNFSGGESFVYPYFLPLVRWAKEQGFEVVINTNGGFDVREIGQYVDEFIFSVHGIGKTHNQIVGVQKEDAFGILESNIALASKMNLKVSINTVLVRMNYDQVIQIFEYFDSRYGLHKFSPTIAIKSLFGRRYDKSALDITKELIENYMGILRQIPGQQLQLKHGFQSVFYNDPQIYTSASIPLPSCAAGKYKLVIEHDGGVYPCNFFKSPEFYCGNLLEEDEYNIWQTGGGFVRFRELVLGEKIPDECADCLKRAMCFSGCRAWSTKYREGGFEYAQDLRCALGHAFIRN